MYILFIQRLTKWLTSQHSSHWHNIIKLKAFFEDDGNFRLEYFILLFSQKYLYQPLASCCYQRKLKKAGHSTILKTRSQYKQSNSFVAPRATQKHPSAGRVRDFSLCCCFSSWAAARWFPALALGQVAFSALPQPSCPSRRAAFPSRGATYQDPPTPTSSRSHQASPHCLESRLLPEAALADGCPRPPTRPFG